MNHVVKFVGRMAVVVLWSASTAVCYSEQKQSINSQWDKGLDAQRGAGLIALQPWVQLMGNRTLGIGWLTSQTADGMVEWTQDAGDQSQWRHSWYAEDGLRQANGISQRAILTDYDPQKPLRFRAVSRPINLFKPYKVDFGERVSSEERSLPALVKDNGATSFLVFNDIHSRLELYPALLSQIKDQINFVVLNGDVLQDPQSTENIVDNLLTPMSWFTSQFMPVFFVRGNHETRGSFARSLKSYLCMPENRYYAAMTLGATRLLFLDSGEDKPDENKEYSGLVEFQPYIEQQIRWLEEEIASVEFKSARWRVVVVHMPPHWSKEEERLRFYDKHMREQFAPLFDRGGVTAVISGHTHRMELVEPCPDKARGFQWPVFIGGAPKLEDAAVIRVDADNSTLHIRGYRADGSIFAEKSWK